MEDSSRPSRPLEVAPPSSGASANEYLRDLAVQELGELRTTLQETGRTLEENRAERRALAAELTAAETSCVARETGWMARETGWKTREAELEAELTSTNTALISTEELLSQCRTNADHSAKESSQTIRAQREHIARLKQQIQRPWRLMAKWALRRAPYSSTKRAH